MAQPGMFRRNKSIAPWRFVAAGALSTLLLLFGLLFFSVELTIAGEGFWRAEYRKLGNAAAMGMEEEDLTAATMRMVSYMRGEAQSIDIMVMVDGEETSMFNDRERAHMVDVKELYQRLRREALVALIAGAALLLSTQALAGLAGSFRPLKSYGWGSAVFLAVLLVLGIAAVSDFSSFWTRFHELFFDNDLWLLDPATSRMINMMPLQLFYDVVLRVGLVFLGLWAAGLALCLLLGLALGRRFAQRAQQSGGNQK